MPRCSPRASSALADEALPELAAQLVAIDSVNPGLIPGAAGERIDDRKVAVSIASVEQQVVGGMEHCAREEEGERLGTEPEMLDDDHAGGGHDDRDPRRGGQALHRRSGAGRRVASPCPPEYPMPPDAIPKGPGLNTYTYRAIYISIGMANGS